MNARTGRAVLVLVLVLAAWLIASRTSTPLRADESADPPRVLAFYYTWYGTPEGPSGRWTHWPEGGHDPDRRDRRGWRDLGAAQHPVDGPYDSLDPHVIRRHAREARESGVDGWISTWWGQGDGPDRALELVLRELEEMGSPLVVAPYLETTRRSWRRAVDDLGYLLERYGSHPRFLRHEGRPVIFVYARAMNELRVDEWRRVLGAVRERHDVLLSADSESAELIGLFGAGHAYNPVTLVLGGADMAAHYARFVGICRGANALDAVTVLPGYDDRQVRRPGMFLSRDGGRTYRRLWRAAREARPQWVLITSFNEWHEGSEIEPSREHGLHYLETTRREALALRATGAIVVEGDQVPGLLVQTLPLRTARGSPPADLVVLDHPSLSCRVIANAAGRALALRLGGVSAEIVSVELVDSVLVEPRVGFVRRLRSSDDTATVVLRADEELHVWSPVALAEHLEKGGYPNGDELRGALAAGADLRLFGGGLSGCRRQRQLVVARGARVPIEVGATNLTGEPLERIGSARIEGPSAFRWSDGEDAALEVAPSARLGETSLALAADVSVDGEPRELRTELRVSVVDAWRLSLERRDGELLAIASPQTSIWSPPPTLSLRVPGREEPLAPGGVAWTADHTVEAFFDLREVASRVAASNEVAKLALEVDWSAPQRREFLVRAALDLGAATEGAGLRHTGHEGGGDGRTRPVEEGGRRGREVLPFEGHPGYAYFAVAEGFVRRGRLVVEADVLSTGARGVELHFDSAASDLPLGGAYASAGRVALARGGSWRTARFVLEDAWLRGRQNFGADFRLHGDGDLVVGRVRVSALD